MQRVSYCGPHRCRICRRKFRNEPNHPCVVAIGVSRRCDQCATSAKGCVFKEADQAIRLAEAEKQGFTIPKRRHGKARSSLTGPVDELQDDEDYDDAWVLSKIEEIQEQLESADTALEAAKGNHRLLLSVFKAREGEAEESMEGGDLEVLDASDSEEAMIVDDPGDDRTPRGAGSSDLRRVGTSQAFVSVPATVKSKGKGKSVKSAEVIDMDDDDEDLVSVPPTTASSKSTRPSTRAKSTRSKK
ncbi:hypothetical protein NLI96_g12726 [Meripilus lineatus]|uniref:Uncharacterized protein n=1 Tax=Meripilus lineatus TaxID=2056292 RepID=A0AAD5YC45_9APHY|nr:hypothetical protein NLI96_g12726 [Physisporinus lineatus]